MLLKTIQFTATAIDQFIKNRLNIDQDMVVLNSIKDITGSVLQENQNKVVLSLINIEPELMPKANPTRTIGNAAIEIRPQLYNLHVLMCPKFDDYKETLRFLDTVILFFQMNPLLTSNTFSNLPDGIEKLNVELESLNYSQMHDIWTAIGADYQPSVVYKIRVISSDS